jgi:hypothetical protein
VSNLRSGTAVKTTTFFGRIDLHSASIFPEIEGNRFQIGTAPLFVSHHTIGSDQQMSPAMWIFTTICKLGRQEPAFSRQG